MHRRAPTALKVPLVVWLASWISSPWVSAQDTTTDNTPLIVCTIPLEPMARCRVGLNDSSTFSGLSIETFRETAKDALNWQEGVDYRFLCVDTDTPTTLYERVVPEDGDCDAFIASTTITSERTEAGVVWAYPYWSGSIGIVTKAMPESSDGWAWTRPFTWQLWLALGLTSLLLPFAVYLLEVLSIKRRVTLKESARGYNEAAWRTMWVIMQGETMAVTNLAARAVVIILAFCSLILSASYTANLAAFLTLKSYGTIDSIADLQGMSVSTVEVYQPRLQSRYGLRTIEAEISSIADIKDEMMDVATGSLTAFLIDKEVAQYYVATWPDCALRLLPQSIEPFDYGLAFAPRTSAEVVSAFSLSILRLTEDGTIPEIGDTFLLSNSPCLKDSSAEDEIGQISFAQVYGLWVLLAAGMACGCLIMVCKRFYKWKRNSDWGYEPEINTIDDSQSTGMGKTASGELARKFERGDSRETKKSDLYRIESHFHDLKR
jgi:ABC-type amino acid transport substrate-binding protein